MGGHLGRSLAEVEEAGGQPSPTTDERSTTRARSSASTRGVSWRGRPSSGPPTLSGGACRSACGSRLSDTRSDRWRWTESGWWADPKAIAWDLRRWLWGGDVTAASESGLRWYFVLPD